jgi:hypothetical protein
VWITTSKAIKGKMRLHDCKDGANEIHSMIDNKGELVAIGAVVGTLFVVDYPVPNVVRG